MDLIEFAQKAWYMDWGFINKPLPEITKKWKENINNQKKYFIVKAKKDKWLPLLPNDVSFWNWDVKNIIW